MSEQVEQAAAGEESFREAVFKVQVLGGDVQEPASTQQEQQSALEVLTSKGRTLAPPVPPSSLLRIWENSGALDQNVQAYVTNIDGLGFRLEPVFDFDHPEIKERIRNALWAERDGENTDAELPSNEEVEEAFVEIKQRARLERVRLENFLANANPEGSFVSLRKAMRQQLEIVGNAYWEVLRNKVGRPARFVLVQATGVRLTAIDETPTEVKDKVATGPLGFAEVVQHRFFRRYVQVVGRETIWFKEYGDPRVVSRKSGKVYKDEDDYKRNAEAGDKPATEMMHFKLSRPGEAYGLPRWFGNLLAVLGSRAADEVNFDYFDNKAIPPLALLVSGGTLGNDSVSKIETYIRDNLKGRRNFHKILIIEAKPTEAQQLSGEGAVPRISFERLGEMQEGDALFQKYDERNTDKIGSSFRLPRLMRGDVRDFNRATAIASLRFAEEQVFEPERQDFDAMFNRKILPALDVSLWRFRSNGHRTRDPEVVVTLIDSLVRRGVLTPNEAREVISDVLGKSFDPIEEDWAKQPLALTLAGFRSGARETSDQVPGESPEREEFAELQAEAQRLANARDAALDLARDHADAIVTADADAEARTTETDRNEPVQPTL